jgi:cell fate regulator YaaT (PSP1 superfamily)
LIKVNNTQTGSIVGVRFSKVGKIYHFDASHLENIKVGDAVIVETSRGWQLGEVAQLVGDIDQSIDGSIKPVDRLATPRDLLLRQMWELKEIDAVEICRKRVAELNLHLIKIIAAEYSFDGTRLAIIYSSEGEEKADLKSLRQDTQRQFAPAQVELRQVGPRDVAKIIGGMGACGLEKRCCTRFLNEFSSISIRMAKDQGISLTPSEITGMCGRLRCCLIYEFETYTEARKGLPKRNKRVGTPEGEGKVVDVLPLQGRIKIDIPEVGVREYTREQFEAFENQALASLQSKPEQPVQQTTSTPPEPPATETPTEEAKEQPRSKQRTGHRPGRRHRGSKRS